MILNEYFFPHCTSMLLKNFSTVSLIYQFGLILGMLKEYEIVEETVP